MSLAAPVLALVVAFIVTSLVLVAVGDPVGEVWKTILAVPKPRQTVNIINAAAVFYMSAIAVAIGFRMNLFNIGVDGQYRIAVVRRRRLRRPGLAARVPQHHRRASSSPWWLAGSGPGSRHSSRSSGASRR